MVKKKVKKMKKKTKEPHKDLYHVTMLLKYTERNIKDDGSELDSYFKDSANKLRERLRGLK